MIALREIDGEFGLLAAKDTQGVWRSFADGFQVVDRSDEQSPPLAFGHVLYRSALRSRTPYP
jgi:hypothetical protein